MTKKIISIFFILIISLSALVGCGTNNNEPTEEITDGSSINSIVSYLKDDTGCQKLISDMREGKVPVSVDVLYDQGGALPSTIVNDRDKILKLYDLFTKITVTDKTDESITDAYHYVYFTLEDKTEVGFSFEQDIWVAPDNNRYKVQNTGTFWKYVQELQASSIS